MARVSAVCHQLTIEAIELTLTVLAAKRDGIVSAKDIPVVDLALQEILYSNTIGDDKYEVNVQNYGVSSDICHGN
jgi:hypothetical protein